MKLIASAGSARSITLFVPVRPSARVHLALHWSLPTLALHVVVSASFTVSFRPKNRELAPAFVLPEERPPLPETWDENGLMTLDQASSRSSSSEPFTWTSRRADRTPAFLQDRPAYTFRHMQ